MISEAALKTFHGRGYHRSRMADIANEAGIGKGTIYEYFRDKEAILLFAFEEYFAAFQTGAMQAMDSAQGPSARLVALIDFALGHVGEWEHHCAVFVDYYGVARTDEKQRFPIAGIYDAMRSLIVQLLVDAQSAGEIRSDVDPTTTAELLLSLYDGVILHGVFGQRSCELSALQATALQVFAQGLLNDPTR